MNKKERVPLGDRVLPSLRNWLRQYSLRRRAASRADVLCDYLSAGETLDAGGNDPLRVLELAIGLQGRGVDPERLLAEHFAASAPPERRR